MHTSFFFLSFFFCCMPLCEGIEAILTVRVYYKTRSAVRFITEILFYDDKYLNKKPIILLVVYATTISPQRDSYIDESRVRYTVIRYMSMYISFEVFKECHPMVTTWRVTFSYLSHITISLYAFQTKEYICKHIRITHRWTTDNDELSNNANNIPS